MRPFYNHKELVLLNSIIEAGLKHLKDDNKNPVNFEKFADTTGNIPGVFAPEWTHYWSYWKTRWLGERTREGREIIFEECISDLRNKGYLRGLTFEGLTGDYSRKVREIIEKTP